MSVFPCHTQAVYTESSIVKEVADVAGTCGHGAECVSTAGCQWVHAAGQQEDQQWPCVRISPHILYEDHRQQLV